VQMAPRKGSLVSGVINEVQVVGGSKFQILDIILVNKETESEIGFFVNICLTF